MAVVVDGGDLVSQNDSFPESFSVAPLSVKVVSSSNGCSTKLRAGMVRLLLWDRNARPTKLFFLLQLVPFELRRSIAEKRSRMALIIILRLETLDMDDGAGNRQSK